MAQSELTDDTAKVVIYDAFVQGRLTEAEETLMCAAP